MKFLFGLDPARKRGCVLGFTGAGEQLLINELAAVYLDAFWETQFTEADQLKGIVVSFGKSGSLITGCVRLIASPTESEDFQRDEILVTAMTTPDFMPILRKAKAVITDEGGLTAHAAVVSRELGIPCIVGTRTATKQLKSGDVIQLNLSTGTVNKAI